MSVYRVALTGGACGGKSSSAIYLRKALGELGFKVYFVPEVATILFTNGAEFPGLDAGQKLIDFETALLQMQMQMEESFLKIARSTGHPSVMFVDRGLLDVGAFLSAERFQEVLRANSVTADDIAARYDAVIHLVTAAHGAEEFYKWGETFDDLGNRVVRRGNAESARSGDDKFFECWKAHPNVIRVENLDDGFEGKMKRVIDFVIKCIADDIGLNGRGAASNQGTGGSSSRRNQSHVRQRCSVDSVCRTEATDGGFGIFAWCCGVRHVTAPRRSSLANGLPNG